MKNNLVFKVMKMVIVSPAFFILAANAQVTPPPSDLQHRNGLSDEFILERISGKQNPEDISDSYAIQFLTPMLVNSDASQIKSLMSKLELTDDQSLEIKRIANASFFANDIKTKSGIAEMCESDNYQTLLNERRDPQALIDLMTNLEVSTSEAYETFVRSEVTRTLGAEFYVNFMLWVDESIDVPPNLSSTAI